ncbi:DegV family protein [Ruminococcus sp.]|uniref:DegV family protein n=1 Tax=Ruminococcus sp. TaxID=41978 RepID=UPI0025F9BB84|nr:DegV family protein [Ruminococcus sp.]MBQ8966771.1 DegV family protein [Ruminococcus sp.]
MPKIKIMTDSASDISAENEKKYDIQVVNFKLAMGEKSYTSRIDFDNEQFYEMMDEYDGIPVTSQITAFEFLENFKELYYNDYTDVIYVSINSKGSSTYNNAVMAAEQFYEEIPEARDEFRIINIDGKGYTGGYGYAVVEAAKKAQKGASVQEIESFIRDWVDNCVIFFGMYSLRYAKKSGRIPAAAAFVGEIMGLRPVSRIQHNSITTEAKVRGDKAIIPKILDLTVNEQIPKTPYCVVYGNDESVRDELIQAMTKKVGYPPADTYRIGSEVAVNAGPKVVGVIFKSQKK